ncbi:hypothetical protein BS50DRAFT_350018 [Corynespora cassiicola Philippines]|uniref:Uncharacterized protein n=1 Tax=Corynespora cassiicola Philippines TaxID=1448308 RepID=A0A2T2NQX2_CORCC|nr:hypothetical protein BS50DRAFT_350018 [Corynespora cassiicola Philippines]
MVLVMKNDSCSRLGLQSNYPWARFRVRSASGVGLSHLQCPLPAQTSSVILGLHNHLSQLKGHLALNIRAEGRAVANDRPSSYGNMLLSKHHARIAANEAVTQAKKKVRSTITCDTLLLQNVMRMFGCLRLSPRSLEKHQNSLVWIHASSKFCSINCYLQNIEHCSEPYAKHTHKFPASPMQVVSNNSTTTKDRSVFYCHPKPEPEPIKKNLHGRHTCCRTLKRPRLW